MPPLFAHVAVATPPFPEAINVEPLFKVRKAWGVQHGKRECECTAIVAAVEPMECVAWVCAGRYTVHSMSAQRRVGNVARP